MKNDKVKTTIQNLRRALNYKGLYEKDAPAQPWSLFEKWLQAAIAKSDFEPNAMTLATASKNGMPSCRTVLLKDYSPDGFVFFTNYDSKKGRNLAENPKASLLFYWPVLSRQVIIEGKVKKVSRQQSEEYFHSRPPASQAAASISPQSRAVTDRDALTEKMKSLETKYKNKIIPCPVNWGGFILQPKRIEFWQGRPDRLHDRLSYSKLKSGRWRRVRLAP
ncbi:MAG: pyridoxamine 5'-phosphate oxidase [Candidatus Omnitrophica bacterium]|nr:pyridoxamine 5'-phosphate oxidase [Candidatus Omnitrophota bacterium]